VIARLWAEGYVWFPQVEFRRVFRPLVRSYADDAEMVTAYTDGRVTFRKNVRLDGYHEAETMQNMQGVRDGDLVVHGLDILRGSVGVSDSTGAISSVCVVCAPIGDVDPRYFAWAIRAQAQSGFPRALARGVREGGADFRRWDTLAELPVPLPAPWRQRAIADFLDAETARIDGLLARRQRQIALLQERTRASLAHWIVQASATSRRVELGILLDRLIDYRGATPVKTESGLPLITASHIVNGRVQHDLLPQFVDETDWQVSMTRGSPKVGDVLLTTEAPLGEVAILEDPNVALAQRLVLLRANQDMLLSRYLYVYLRSPIGSSEVQRRASGSTVLGIRADRLRSVPVVVPDLATQDWIALQVGDLEKATEQAVDLLLRQQSLLQDRKQALITAAVTGQLDFAREIAEEAS
jgi:type I restriction enzyme, S subunit